MKPGNKNSYKSLKSLNINGKNYNYYSPNFTRKKQNITARILLNKLSKTKEQLQNIL